MNATFPNSVTVGSTVYLVSPGLLKRIKSCCKIANIPWQTIAARPSEAVAFCKHVEILSGSYSRYQTGK